jgi:hypothetical protein
VVIPVSYAALWEAMRERERQGRWTRWGWHTREVLGEAVEEGLVGIVLCWLFLQGVYIVGKGHPYPSTKPPRAAARGGEGAGIQGRSARETLTLAGLSQGWAPPFFFSFFPNGLLSPNQPI